MRLPCCLRLAVLSASCGLTAYAFAAPQAPPRKADPRVKAALDGLNFEYSLTDRKDYQIEFKLPAKRSQVVFVTSHTEEFGGQEIREVHSTAYKVKGRLTPSQVLRMLTDNGRRKWGGWRAVRRGGFLYVIYAVQISAQADAAEINDAIDAVLYTADEKEKEVTGRDEF